MEFLRKGPMRLILLWTMRNKGIKRSTENNRRLTNEKKENRRNTIYVRDSLLIKEVKT